MVEKINQSTEVLRDLSYLLQVCHNLKMDDLSEIVVNKIKEELEKDFGELLIMDLKAIPSKEGWTFDKWLNYVKEHRIAFMDKSLNTKNESTRSTD